MSDVLFEAEGQAATADISACGRYRYHLTRTWDQERPNLTFIMCNPSIADALIVDPTITRCIGFATRFGYGGITVVNAYAWRATKPADLWAAHRAGADIVGPENDTYLTGELERAATAVVPVVAAWGAHPKPDRVAQVLALPHADGLRSLGVTRSGQPRHPLMLRSDTPLTPWPQEVLR
ncbi:MAG TPA: DUF1643 domain-containing protein [Propionibacteriaceae bacterium]|jgi:hypothetical protein